ncbi:MAG: SDR family oxidoreductase [Patescibacteria group bacterium]
MKILGTGLLGLVGSRITALLKDRYEFESSDVDITDRQGIIERIKNSNASTVLHLAAKTDVDGCEKDKLLGENGDAWKVNVNGTKNVTDACQEGNKKLIYISTDFVFDGEKTLQYTEEDTANPINWYGKTKLEGEKIVQNASIPWVIARIAYPYRANFVRNDFLRTILKRLQGRKKVVAITDHIFTPTFIDDIAFAIDKLIKKEALGVFHVVGNEPLSPYDAVIAITKAFGFDQKDITKTTRSEFFRNRAPRPFHLALKNDKIGKLGVKMRTFEEGIQEIRRQISNF